MKIQWSQRSNNNMWRELLKFDKIPICKFLDNAIRLPYFDNLLSAYQQAFPTFPTSCPILASPYYIRNMSNGDYDIMKETFLNNFGGLPNGEYKILLNVFSFKDPNIYTISWQVEISNK